ARGAGEVVADRSAVQQILINLVGNAIKFTEQGEILVTVTATPAAAGRARLHVAVRDTGIGIAPEHLASIFGEFAQADSTMTRRYGGTGLGLAISQRLVRLMGGELTVMSEVGRGTEFSFRVELPVEADVAARGAARTALGGRRMLVVDDNQTNRRILREMLAVEAVAVDEAATAAEGLAALHRAAAQGAPYDAAVLDVQMPDQDGFELAATIRQDRALARTSLLMLTSAGQRGDGERCRELGIRAYLTKPLSRIDLLEALGAVLATPAPPTAEGVRGPGADVITRHTIAESRRALRILLAEDNPVNRQVAVAMLVKRGHEVHVAVNGKEAVDAVTRRDYDVVLMDIQMPVLDGFQATAALRAMPRGKDIRIIALTAHALSGERERCLSHGMSDYLAKPFKAHDLFALVEEGGEGSRSAIGADVEIGDGAPPVDLEGFRMTLREAGAEEAVDSILDAFLRQAPERLDALTTALGAAEAGAIAAAAHTFRGAAATIGAQELAGFLEQMETAARAGDVEQARSTFERADAVARNVVAYIASQRAPSPAGGPAA
ncbi:MAG: response regulator, partial [Gemmatimonadales bacterium]|nr:response regulator [Gemmatimonadales bacterium]